MSLEPLNAITGYQLLHRAINKIAQLPGPRSKAIWIALSVLRVIKWSNERRKRTRPPLNTTRWF